MDSPWPIPWPDEGIFADIARNLLHEGRLGTDLFGDAIPGLADRTYWTPPLYYLLLAAWLGLFGEGLWVQRSLSLAAGVAAVVALYRIARHLGLAQPWIVPVWLAVDVVFVRGCLVGRMDTLCLALWLWGLATALERRQALAGAFAGLALCTHPMGVVGALGVALLSPTRRTAVAAAAVLGPWALYIALDPALFWVQWSAQMARKAVRDPLALASVHRAWLRLTAQYQPLPGIGPFLWGAGAAGLALLNWRWAAVHALAWGLALWGAEMWYAIYLVPVSLLGLLALVGRFPPVARGWVVAPLVMACAIALNQQADKRPPLPAEFFDSAGPYEGGGIPDPYWYMAPRGVELHYASPVP